LFCFIDLEYTSSSEDDYDDDYDEESDELVVTNEKGHKVLGEVTWRNVQSQVVTKVPFNIDGLSSFSIKGSCRADTLQRCRDGRPWKPDTRTKWSGYDVVRYKNCNGSLCCPNLQCPFAIKFKEANRLKFDKSSRSCNICGAIGLTMSCPARKYTAFISDKHAHIFHYGKHTCQPKVTNDRPVKIVSSAVLADPRTKPSEIQGNAILSAIRKRKPWTDVSKLVKRVTDKRAISNEKIKQCKQLFPNGEGYDAVTEYKTYTDKKDTLLVYCVNENLQNVFKTSTEKMRIAKEMCSSSSMFSDEYCYFDGKVKRCKNFTTLTASMYHSLLQRQIPLAIMECKGEDSANVGRFWNYFNKAYKDVNEMEERFSPTGWISDMATANFNGLQLIYGEEVLTKIKGCEFHFRQSINRHSSKCENAEAFKVSLAFFHKMIILYLIGKTKILLL